MRDWKLCPHNHNNYMSLYYFKTLYKLPWAIRPNIVSHFIHSSDVIPHTLPSLKCTNESANSRPEYYRDTGNSPPSHLLFGLILRGVDQIRRKRVLMRFHLKSCVKVVELIILIHGGAIVYWHHLKGATVINMASHST